MEHVYVQTTHSGTPTQTLMHYCSLDEGFKSSSYLTETLLDPELGHAHATNKTAFNKAHNVDEDYWSWLERPDNRLRLARFGAAMNGLGNMTPKDAILEGSVMLRGVADHHLTRKYLSKGYAWDKLPEGSLVVDVGGGVGSQSLTLATHFPQLRFVVQDREPVVRDAVEVRCLRPTLSGCGMYLIKYGPQFWKKNMPEALESGRVKPQSLFISVLHHSNAAR